jgi:three-Cys-motif partner protein
VVTDFFDEQTEQSAIKADIVVAYFAAWAAIMVRRSKTIAYLDLYAGPGRYGDANKSTPLLILEKTIATPNLRSSLKTVFNDADIGHVQRLRQEVASIEGIDALTFEPDIRHGVVGDEQLALLNELGDAPVLAFVDPWGYKGLSLDLIRRLLRGFGSDVIFFFNYDRINRDITNDLVEKHMVSLFGDARLRSLQTALPDLNSGQREDAISRALAQALEEMGGSFLIPFKFRRGQQRISHYICFVSKHPRGYQIMKDIMAKRGLVDADGVPRFEYLPGGIEQQLSLFDERPIQFLARDLKAKFEGRSVSVEKLFEEHHLGTPFILRNYKTALMELEQAGEIECNPNAATRKRDTLANHVVVTFPSLKH